MNPKTLNILKSIVLGIAICILFSLILSIPMYIGMKSAKKYAECNCYVNNTSYSIGDSYVDVPAVAVCGSHNLSVILTLQTGNYYNSSNIQGYHKCYASGSGANSTNMYDIYYKSYSICIIVLVSLMMLEVIMLIILGISYMPPRDSKNNISATEMHNIPMRIDD